MQFKILYWSVTVWQNSWIPLAASTLRFCGTLVEKHCITPLSHYHCIWYRSWLLSSRICYCNI